MTIPRNPLTMRGRIERCWIFSHRTPAAAVREILPAPLEPVTRGGFAFWNIVVCRMAAMRPAPLPAWCGFGYWHVAYRLHVRVRIAGLGAVDGLFFVRSDCDRAWVAAAGNALTDFRFHPARFNLAEVAARSVGSIDTPGGNARFIIDGEKMPELREGSPFVSVAEAAAFLKYPPCAIAPMGAHAVQLVRVTRDERAWQSRPVAVREQQWDFLAGRDTTPELCTEVAPIAYQWNRGERAEVAS